MATRPVLIVEGAGDAEAVPLLIRSLTDHRVQPMPNPLQKQNVPRLSREGELEKFATHALRRDGDSVLFLLDVDEGCVFEIVREWVPRLAALQPSKKIGIGLFVREFESFFLASLDAIAAEYPQYGWSLEGWTAADDHEAPRGVKERLSGRMKQGRA